MPNFSSIHPAAKLISGRVTSILGGHHRLAERSALGLASRPSLMPETPRPNNLPTMIFRRAPSDPVVRKQKLSSEAERKRRAAAVVSLSASGR